MRTSLCDLLALRGATWVIKKIVEKIYQNVDRGCVAFSSSMKVRGYDNVVVRRSIHDFVPSAEQAYAAMRSNGGCQSVWIEGFQYATDIPAYRKAVITDANGKVLKLLAADRLADFSRPPGCRSGLRDGAGVILGLWNCYSTLYWPLPDPLRLGSARS